MKLTIVGCSGSISGPESPASAYLVQAPYADGTYSLLLDLGPGALGALFRYLDPSQVDAVALSHLHPDHCLDLCAFYVAGRYSPSAPWPRCPVYGPPGTAARLARAYGVDGLDDVHVGPPEPGIDEHFDYRDWQAEQVVGPFTVTTTRVRHPVAAYAIRVAENTPGGGRLVFSGDTGPCPQLVELAGGCDLLLAEAAFLDQPGNPPDLHLSGREAAEIGQAAGAGTVVLTHIPPWHDSDLVLAQARPHFDGPVELARPGAVWEIGCQS